MSRDDDIQNDRSRITRIDAPLRWPWIASTVVFFLLSVVLFTLLIRGRDSKDQSGDGNPSPDGQTNTVAQSLDNAKINKAQLECDTWEKAVNTCYVINPENDFPATLSDPNVMKYIESAASKIEDPWGNRYQLEIKDNGSGGQIPVVFTIYPRTGQRITKRGLNK